MTHVSKVTCHNVLDDSSAFNNIWQQLLLKIHFGGYGGYTRIGVFLHDLQSLQKSHENSAYFWVVCRACRGWRRAFSKAFSTMKALCDPEQPLIDHGGLSHLGQQHEVAFLRVSSSARPEVWGPGYFYFRLSINIAAITVQGCLNVEGDR